MTISRQTLMDTLDNLTNVLYEARKGEPTQEHMDFLIAHRAMVNDMLSRRPEVSRHGSQRAVRALFVAPMNSLSAIIEQIRVIKQGALPVRMITILRNRKRFLTNRLQTAESLLPCVYTLPNTQDAKCAAINARLLATKRQIANYIKND